MKIFILEDDPNRMKTFKKALSGHSIDHATNCEEGRTIVSSNTYDLIFLDHDLGGEQMVDSSHENTGYQLAKFMKENGYNTEVPCIVHSCNPDGADNIASLLCHAVKIPFPFIDFIKVLSYFG